MKQQFKVLIACEYSAMVRTAFEQLPEAGLFNVWSADILPSDVPSKKHYQGDVMNILFRENWDLLIGFPECRYLTYAGMSSWYQEGRAMKRIQAAMFFMQLYDSGIKHICIENPQGIMSKIFREPDQEIHPYFFGDNEMKRTQLWLKNLPCLTYDYLQPSLFGDHVVKPKPYSIQRRKKTGQIKFRYFHDMLFSKETRSIERSKTFPCVARAMAEQWSKFLIENYQSK